MAFPCSAHSYRFACFVHGHDMRNMCSWLNKSNDGYDDDQLLRAFPMCYCSKTFTCIILFNPYKTFGDWSYYHPHLQTRKLKHWKVSTLCGFRNPLGSWDVSPWIRGDDCTEVLNGERGGKLIYANLSSQNPQVPLADNGSHRQTWNGRGLTALPRPHR